MIPRRSCKAFTLIELLVVVAIIALLIGILLPLLASAREQWRGVVCSSNVGQLVVGWTLYTDDHRGAAMPHLQQTSSDRQYWYGTERAGSPSIEHDSGTLSAYLSAALGDRSVYECPNQPDGSYTRQGQARSFTSTYGYNGYGLAPSTTGYHTLIGQRSVRSHQIQRPSKLVVFADSLISLFGDQPSNSALLDPPRIYAGHGHWIENYSPTTAFRHGVDRSSGFGQAVNARADGSVHRSSPDAQSRNLPEHAIGSLSSENDPYYIESPQRWK